MNPTYNIWSTTIKDGGYIDYYTELDEIPEIGDVMIMHYDYIGYVKNKTWGPANELQIQVDDVVRLSEKKLPETVKHKVITVDFPAVPDWKCKYTLEQFINKYCKNRDCTYFVNNNKLYVEFN